jgi:hypothetical protein
MNPADLLLSYLRAYEARDIDAVGALLSDDVRLQDWNLAVQGKAAVLAETQRNFDDAAQLQIEVLALYTGEAGAAARLRIVVNAAIELEVVDTITVDASGRVSSIRAYKG